MEPSLLFSSHKVSSFTSFPFFISNKLPSLDKPFSSVKTHCSLSIEKSDFLGKGLILSNKNANLVHLRKTHHPFSPIRAAVKRRKELPFDNVIQRDKKLKLVLKIRKILVSHPDRTMSLKQMGRFRKQLGLQRKRRFIALLRKFPGVFEIVEEGVYSLKFKLTPEADRLYLEELRIRNEMEDLLVLKLRKLLMMSIDKQILLEKIAHLSTDLGLPTEFRQTICLRYPQYFRVIQTGKGPALELTHWDPQLAVSAAELSAEENRAREVEEQNLIIDRPRRFKTVMLPKGLKLSKGELRKIMQFRDIPYISPYADFSHLVQGSREKEKHACGVVHEILSLTVEKRTLIDHLTHFREEFRFSQQLRGMLIRHPDMFYISLKGTRDSVFLREAYRDSQLIEKDRLLLIKEKLRSLVSVPRFPPRRRSQISENGMGGTNISEDEDQEIEEEWSDDDNFMTDDDDDFHDDVVEDDGEGDWSEDDEDTPPDFDDDTGIVDIGARKQSKEVGKTMKDDEKDLSPLFPDGRPRERW